MSVPLLQQTELELSTCSILDFRRTRAVFNLAPLGLFANGRNTVNAEFSVLLTGGFGGGTEGFRTV